MELISQTMVDSLPAEIFEHLVSFCKDFSPLLRLVCKKWREEIPNNVSSQLFSACARHGFVELMKKMARGIFRPWVISADNLTIAVANGQDEVVSWILEQNQSLMSFSLYFTAARNGHLSTMKLLWSKGQTPQSSTFASAAKFGSYEILNWLLEIDCPKDEFAFKAAAEKGDIEMVEWLEKRDFPAFENSICHAANSQQPEMVAHLRGKGFEWGDIMEWASIGGCLESIQYAYSQGVLLTGKIFENAIENGDVEMCQWVYDNGGVCVGERGSFCECLESNNSLETFKWAASKGFSFSFDDYADSLVCYSNLPVIQWLRSIDEAEGRPWNTDLTLYAIVFGQLELLQWLIQQGCPWSDESFWTKTDYSYCKKTLKWALQNGYNQSVKTAIDATWADDLELLKWVVVQGLPWDFWACLEETVNNGSEGDVFDWLIEHFLELD